MQALYFMTNGTIHSIMLKMVCEVRALKILGLDPGLATIGYGVVETNGFRHRMIDYGVITTPPKTALPERLKMIYQDVHTLMERVAPDAVAIEELFFNTNVTTGINVAHARGVILISVSDYTDHIYEYTPLQIKQAVVGYGRADKIQVQRMVQTLLKLDKIPRPDDAADALAVALCHANTNHFSEQFRVK